MKAPTCITTVGKVCVGNIVFKLLIETKKLEKYLFCKILTSNHKLLPYFKYYNIFQNLTCLCPSQVIQRYCRGAGSS